MFVPSKKHMKWHVVSFLYRKFSYYNNVHKITSFHAEILYSSASNRCNPDYVFICNQGE